MFLHFLPINSGCLTSRRPFAQGDSDANARPTATCCHDASEEISVESGRLHRSCDGAAPASTNSRLIMG